MKKILDYIKNNYKTIIFIAVLLIANFVIINKAYYGLEDNTGKRLYMFIIITAIAELLQIIYACLVIRKIEKIKIEKLYLLLAIPLSILYFCIIPINDTPDEMAHIYRSYDVSYGHLISGKQKGVGGGYLTSSLDDIQDKYGDVLHLKYEDLKDIRLEYKPEGKWYWFATSCVYSFVGYVPQSIGILIGRVFHLSPVIQIYMARAFNLIVWLALIYLCIKLSTNFKHIILCLALMPVCLQTSISCSGDVLTIAISLLICVFVEHLIYKYNDSKKETITKKEFSILLLCAIVLSQLKIVYFPIMFLYLLIPVKAFKDKKHKILSLLSIFIIALIFNFVWTYISFGFIAESNPGVNAIEQVKYVLHYPHEYIMILYNQISIEFDYYLTNFVGSSLEWLNVGIDKLYVYIYIFILLFISLFNNIKKVKNFKNKGIILSGLILLIITGLIFTSLYVQWNPVKSTTITGVQGRYFIPVFILISYLLSSINVGDKSKIKIDYKYIYLFIAAINIIALATLFIHHI